MTKSDAVVYVGIEEPINLRRALLESSKSMVHLLRGQQNVAQLRAAKHKSVEDLRNILAQINELVTQAKQLVPPRETINLPMPEKEEKAEKVKVVKAKAKPVPVKKPKLAVRVEAHVDKLERELQDIEKKLKTL